jgi:hypothetical protein
MNSPHAQQVRAKHVFMNDAFVHRFLRESL